MSIENLSVGEIQRQLREHLELLQSTDFDQLCDDGILERKGKNKYKVPSLQHLKQLPEKLRIQIEKFKVQRDGSIVVDFVKLQRQT